MKAMLTLGGKILLTSENETEGEFLEEMYHQGFVYGAEYCDKAGLSRNLALMRIGAQKQTERLTVPIISTASQTLSYIPSQRQAAKVASYFAELHAHHIPQEFAEQLTLEYQRMEMENA